MKKILTFAISMVLGVTAYSQISVNETFETSALPSGWSYTPSSTGWVSSTASPLNGNRSLRKSISATTAAPSPVVEFITKNYTESNGNEITVAIKTRAHRFSDRIINGQLQFMYSIDNGSSWTNLGDLISYNEAFDTSLDPITKGIITSQFTISADKVPVGSQFKLKAKTSAALLLDGTQNNFYIYFDDLVITQSTVTLPSCTTFITPTNNAENFGVDQNFTWSPVGGAEGYRIYLGEQSGVYSILDNVDLGNVTSYKLTTNLKSNTQYFIKVVPYNVSGSAVNCEEITFKTKTTPINDEVADAILLTPSNDIFCEGGLRGTFKNASKSVEELGCTTSANPNNDVWYKFVATAKRHVITLTPTDGSVSDLYFTLYEGEPNQLIKKECIDEERAILDDLVVGKTYYIRLFTYSNNLTDSEFDICLSTASVTPQNDDQSTALLIEKFTFDQKFDTSGYTKRSNLTEDDLISTCSMYADINLEGINLTTTNVSDDGVWFKFKGNGSNFSVRTITDNFWDARIDVYRSLTDQEKQTNPTFANLLTCVGTRGAQVTDFTHTVNIETSNKDVMYYVNVSNFTSATKQPTGVVQLIVMTDNLGINEQNKSQLTIYPNPVTDKIFINSDKKINQIKVFSIDGKELIKTSNSEISLSHLIKGIYIIQIQTKDGKITEQKIIKN